jgi:hypothetical protein
LLRPRLGGRCGLGDMLEHFDPATLKQQKAPLR